MAKTRWDGASTRAKTKAAHRAAVVKLVNEQVRQGRSYTASLLAVGTDLDIDPRTLRRWATRAREAARTGLVATTALVDRPRSGRRTSVWQQPGAEEAWQLWKANYLRLEHPSAKGCWETVRRVALTRGWVVPNIASFNRRLRAETPTPQIVRAREGRLGALQTYPFQRRTVADLAPLEIVNGDGYRHNLFVTPAEGGSPIRPITWFWQDVRTRKILAWRSGLTESADLVRLAFHDLVSTAGVPSSVLQDNTRAASAVWFGGSSQRWRADKGEVVEGILQHLDVDVRRTGIEREANGKARGRGWCKPIERSFLDLGEEIDRHPRAAGAWTGASTADKPANYDSSHALTWDAFTAVVADGVAQHNARPGRETEVAQGRSFDAVWEQEMATTPVRRLTRAQEALLLMAVESTRVARSGIFRLKAGRASGVPSNDFYHPDLTAIAGQHVVARFDPQRLHGGVEVFDLGGRWLCHAECRMAVGFADTTAAREHNRARRAWQRGLDQADAARQKVGALMDAHGVDLPPAAAASRPALTLVSLAPARPKPGRPDTERRRALEARRDRGLRRVEEA